MCNNYLKCVDVTNQIQTEWVYYNCFVIQYVSRSKAFLACVSSIKENDFTAGFVNGRANARKPYFSCH